MSPKTMIFIVFASVIQYFLVVTCNQLWFILFYSLGNICQKNVLMTKGIQIWQQPALYGTDDGSKQMYGFIKNQQNLCR